VRYILFVCEQNQKAKVKGDTYVGTANTTKKLIKSVVEKGMFVLVHYLSYSFVFCPRR